MIVASNRALARLAIFCGVIGAIPVISQQPPAPSKSIFGAYGQPAAGHDSIQIIEKAAGRIGVDLKLYYANGHTCRLNQDGQWNHDHVAIVAEGLDPNHSCRLDLFFQNNRVLLKDDGLQCAPVYCGTRGRLDKVSLAKFNPSSK